MKRYSAFYFSDIKDFLSKHKKELLIFLALFIAGTIIGIVIGSNAESDYSGSFILILSNEFNPFKSFWIYSAISTVLCALAFCSGIKNIFAILLFGATSFVGYVFGRVCFFSVTENVFWGVVSLIVFVIPNNLAILCTAYAVYCKMRKTAICGSFKNYKPLLLWCVKPLAIELGVCFVLNVIIGGIINLMINVV